MSTMKSLTLNDTTYNSFTDKEAVKSINGATPDDNGNVSIAIPDLENYATKEYLADEIDAIRHEVATQEYVDNALGDIETLLGGI